jgi:gamma-glutamylcyclotransferase (GGCT)/AIG2-like uncharacterized protein YtfP
MPDEFVFVYGTLRKEISSSMSKVLSSHCDFYSQGHMHGKMYELGGYPGVIESDNPEDIVYGDIYSIKNPATLFSILDEYEECSDSFRHPHEYIRKRMLISLAEKRSISAWVYIYNHDVTGLRRIKSGDYINQ